MRLVKTKSQVKQGQLLNKKIFLNLFRAGEPQELLAIGCISLRYGTLPKPPLSKKLGFWLSEGINLGHVTGEMPAHVLSL